MKTTFHKLSLTSAFLVTFAVITTSGLLRATAQNKYPQAIVNEYMRSCQQSAVRGGLSQQQAQRLCTCTINRFQSRFTLEQFRNLTRQGQESGKPPEAMTEVGMACAEEVLR